MASLIDCLIEDLTNENDGYEKLLSLSNEKTSAIVSGNIEKLQEIFLFLCHELSFLLIVSKISIILTDSS